ncbi:MAG: hypothetical protein A2Z21_04090 [Candidatus Fraserbacteria bacterium RBG_16_55_9]|uniref:Transcription regulator AsnC/Lrp ligand binding domain-containing protein n=1 Tax=Fraserbacteria sp. (strain RBG_16_55_9) TaxID=1817864 RepID=A0A1F5UY80_FRAXR|nr:MAG: hypothetical protein A2Z21_04090 [Candidatus Fraserbacteria bacterium RBG_16_55_9]
MAVHAYVLIRCEGGKMKQVVEQLRKKEHVVRANTVFGDYDIICRIKVSEMPSSFSVLRLEEVVVDEIQKIKGVLNTNTHIVTSMDPHLDQK